MGGSVKYCDSNKFLSFKFSTITFLISKESPPFRVSENVKRNTSCKKALNTHSVNSCDGGNVVQQIALKASLSA